MSFTGSKVKFFKNAPIELKFTWNDPCDILNILKMKWRSKGKGHVWG